MAKAGAGPACRVVEGCLLMGELHVKRVYDPVSVQDGYRILCDRLWPRGISKSRAALDEWAKAMTPSADLRRLFHAGQLDWPAFSAAYRSELLANPDFPAWAHLLKARLLQGPVTLLTAAALTEQNHIRVLVDLVLAREESNEDRPS